MYLIKMWDAQDREIIIDMHAKPIEPETANDFSSWMDAKISCGRTTLFIAAILTVSSIVTMLIKHI